MWLLDARVDHFNENVGVVREFYHELLVLLHHPEAVLVDNMCVVEEQVIFRGQLDLHVLEVVWLTLRRSWG